MTFCILMLGWVWKFKNSKGETKGQNPTSYRQHVIERQQKSLTEMSIAWINYKYAQFFYPRSWNFVCSELLQVSHHIFHLIGWMKDWITKLILRVISIAVCHLYVRLTYIYSEKWDRLTG